ncbi:MAG: TlpA family protein disulfide reductase [Myxococcales bacterium]
MLLLACAHPPVSQAENIEAYELVLPDLVGQPVSLATYRGKVVVLNFFATWCFPCLGEIPLLKGLQEQRGPEGVQVVGVGLDREAELVLRPFSDYYRLPYPILVGADRFAEPGLPFAPIHTLPTTFVVSREGTVVARWEGVLPAQTLDKLISAALALR